MRNFSFYLILLLSLYACTEGEKAGGKTRSCDFTRGWLFQLGDDPSMANANYNDAGWRKLDLPHDWAIEGDFSIENPSGPGGGALPGGTGWYRKHFTLDPQDQGKKIRLDFDGSYMNTTVYLNGKELGTRNYGYISFSFDLTPHLNREGENVLAVRVDNSGQPSSRWYSGCGIYRNVWLTKLNPIHVAQWGTYITTENVSEKSAHLTVRTTLENYSNHTTQVELTSELLDHKGSVVASAQAQTVDIAANKQQETTQEMEMEQPKLWDIDTPYLYEVKTTVRNTANGELLDTYYTPVGIRHFEFSATKGFILNGKQTKINGVCMHHDLGCLGAAVNTRAIERQLEILKEMGCNGIRTSHNPPAPELLDLCDRMGFIVMDEAFDMWRRRKTPHDYGNYFNEWHERDLRDWLVRDRNHPSIFMWSIGNEVLEQWSDATADTLSLAEANLLLNFGQSPEMLAKEGEEMSVNSMLTKKLADMTRSIDPTRPVTAGCNEVNPYNHLFRSNALDIIGFNYHDEQFASVPERFPGKPFIITESVSSFMTRGYYRMPSDTLLLWPFNDRPQTEENIACSSYGNCFAQWGSRHEGTLRHVVDNDFISGQYIWTGFDYIGEPTPYWFPARSSYFGIIDLAGFPKDIYYMYQSEWRPEKEVLHLFPHWNWVPGQDIDMWAFYNNADEVELFVNGKSQGVRRKPEGGDFHVMWRVKYEPGTVKAVSRKNGKIVQEREIHTAGEPAQIRLTPDRKRIASDGKDLSFITVEVLDKEGNLCPNAESQITFSVQGAGFNAGVDNGSPISMERFKDDHRKAFYGKCLLVVQNDGTRGNIAITATADGLPDASVNLKAN